MQRTRMTLRLIPGSRDKSVPRTNTGWLGEGQAQDQALATAAAWGPTGASVARGEGRNPSQPVA